MADDDAMTRPEIIPFADEHVPVLEALRARDPGLAVDVLHRHFDAAAAGLARSWPDEAPTSPVPALAVAPGEPAGA